MSHETSVSSGLEDLNAQVSWRRCRYGYMRSDIDSAPCLRAYNGVVPTVPRPAATCGGFSLIEAVLAVALLAFSLVSYSALMMGVVAAEREAQRRTAATGLVLDKLEQLRSTPFAAITSGSDAPMNGAGEADAADSMFTRSWIVSNNTPVPGTRTILILCTWADKSGSKTVRLDTVVSS